MYLAKVRRDIVYLDEAATSEYKIVIFLKNSPTCHSLFSHTFLQSLQ